MLAGLQTKQKRDIEDETCFANDGDSICFTQIRRDHENPAKQIKQKAA